MKQSSILIIAVIAIVLGLTLISFSAEELGLDEIFELSEGDSSPSQTSDVTDETEEESETPSAGDWELIGTGSEWKFIGAGDFAEWSLDFGDDWIPGKHKIEISRRWNFKDVFECEGDGSVVWCLHDSYDNRIWHREDTMTILNFITDTIYSGVYDGRPWTFFIGNNYDCEIDPHWSVKFYNWVE